MLKANSAENTRPRKRSSVCNCSSVVENTQQVEPPECAMHDRDTSSEQRAGEAQQQVADSAVAKPAIMPSRKRCWSVAGPAAGDDRSEQRSDAAASHQQAHAEHARRFRVEGPMCTG